MQNGNHLDGPQGDSFPLDPSLFSHPSGMISVSTRGAHLENNGDIGSSQEVTNNGGFLGPEDDDEELSDADSEYREHRDNLNAYRNGVLDLRDRDSVPDLGELTAADLLNGGWPQRRKQVRQRIGRPKPRGGANKGPRRAAEPTGEIRLMLGAANQAFVELDHETAMDIAHEVIRLNAETHEAWTLMASIFREREDHDNALKALIFAAHLQPKIISSWMAAAGYALHETGELRHKYLTNAQFAYAGAIRADPKSREARFGKACVLFERGQNISATSEFRNILGRYPHDFAVLRKLAEISIDEGNVDPMIQEYRSSIDYVQASGANPEDVFEWNDLDTYVTLYEVLGQYDIAISELKKVARWCVGRESESFWDKCIAEDSEWDVDESRRGLSAGFDLGQPRLVSNNKNIPPELRSKLFFYRLKTGAYKEAMHHIDILNLLDENGRCRHEEFYQLLRPIAEHFAEVSLYGKALEFYRPLQSEKYVDSTLMIDVGKCYLHLGQDKDAEVSFKRAIDLDNEDVDARMELARMYERLDKSIEAFQFVSEVMMIRRLQRAELVPAEGDEGVGAGNETKEPVVPSCDVKQQPRRKAISRAQADEVSKAQYLADQYRAMSAHYDGMRCGEKTAITAWMEAAKDLTDDFRSFRTFYPWDKFIKFLGYSEDTRAQAETSLDSDLSEMATRLSKGFADESSGQRKVDGSTPQDYRGISFNQWLDIFLEYALCLAREGNSRASYEICEAASDAIVFYHSKEDMFLIHVSWCMCALLSSDEETCVAVTRFFMRDYQFTTDSYRMFSAVTRVCHSPVSWYSSGPTQKYILRQIKAMDYALVDDARRNKHFAERGSYAAVDEAGNPLVNTDMDIALLMLYGHILFTGTSYSYALNYFLRAYALDPANPMICLNIGLAYIHHGLKRQADNRQHSVLQGISFMLMYYENRKSSVNTCERQEAHYNMARIYHLLGLPHLAIPYYQLVFDEIADGHEISTRDEVVVNTAYNLQSLFALAGNTEQAQHITQRWLSL